MHYILSILREETFADWRRCVSFTLDSPVFFTFAESPHLESCAVLRLAERGLASTLVSREQVVNLRWLKIRGFNLFLDDSKRIPFLYVVFLNSRFAIFPILGFELCRHIWTGSERLDPRIEQGQMPDSGHNNG